MSSLFCIDVSACAVMSNLYHLVVNLDPEHATEVKSGALRRFARFLWPQLPFPDETSNIDSDCLPITAIESATEPIHNDGID
jgi:hypothetical protein